MSATFSQTTTAAVDPTVNNFGAQTLTPAVNALVQTLITEYPFVPAAKGTVSQQYTIDLIVSIVDLPAVNAGV